MHTTVDKALFTSAQSQLLDRALIEKLGIQSKLLMAKAAYACFSKVENIARKKECASIKITVVVGAGNNAGDGLMIAALAKMANMDVSLIMLFEKEKLTEDASYMYQHAKSLSVPVFDIEALGWDALSDYLKGSDIIVDAIFGTGLNREVSGVCQRVIECINNTKRYTLSVDVPSGINATTGSFMGQAVHADMTVVLLCKKIGLYMSKAPSYTGELIFAPLVMDENYQKALAIAEMKPAAKLLTKEILFPIWAFNKHAQSISKIDKGHIGIIAGDKSMAGAAIMSSKAALTLGAGRVSLFTHPEHAALINTSYPEIMCYGVDDLDRYGQTIEQLDVLAVGPGMLRTNLWSQTMVAALKKYNKPMVVDAGALDLMADYLTDKNDIVITPHEGEAARILDCKSSEIQQNRLKAVCDLSDKLACHVLLKGKGTLVYDHQTKALSLCDKGAQVLATAGSGDVLTGMIAGIYGGCRSLIDAASIAVFLQGCASEYYVKEKGLFGFYALDILPFVSEVINNYLSQNKLNSAK